MKPELSVSYARITLCASFADMAMLHSAKADRSSWTSTLPQRSLSIFRNPVHKFRTEASSLTDFFRISRASARPTGTSSSRRCCVVERFFNVSSFASFSWVLVFAPSTSSTRLGSRSALPGTLGCTVTLLLKGSQGSLGRAPSMSSVVMQLSTPSTRECVRARDLEPGTSHVGRSFTACTSSKWRREQLSDWPFLLMSSVRMFSARSYCGSLRCGRRVSRAEAP
mmetsp:Transcript_48899/g.93479  ORF Transcript_48899/g.93479 Transcript_48899/m.93479 type:complete len:224 (+) Transcript_48899:1744-2415(+)